MSDEKRPGGLTAMAVLNFVFGGMGGLAMLSLLVIVGILTAGQEVLSEPEMVEMKQAFEEAGIGIGFFIVMVVISAISSALLIVSGIGYLKQKKFMGRTLGNTYAVLSIVYAMVAALTLPVVGGGGFSLGTIIGLIYPLVTLFVLNMTFKEDFIH